MATLAVFIALGGGAVAAFKLPKNSVGTAQLKKSAVTNAKLAANAITGRNVRDGSLTGSDVNVSTLSQVPSAAAANFAVVAKNANHAASADSATNSVNASHATNSDRLAGSPPSAFEPRLNVSCPGGIRDLQAGSSDCVRGSITQLSFPLTAADGGESFVGDNAELSAFCHDGGNGTELQFVNFAGTGAVLNWLYSTGTNAVAGGVALNPQGPGDFHNISFAGGRIEGQFILSNPSSLEEATINIHALDNGGSCEVFGTAVDAP